MALTKAGCILAYGARGDQVGAQLVGLMGGGGSNLEERFWIHMRALTSGADIWAFRGGLARAGLGGSPWALDFLAHQHRPHACSERLGVGFMMGVGGWATEARSVGTKGCVSGCKVIGRTSFDSEHVHYILPPISVHVGPCIHVHRTACCSPVGRHMGNHGGMQADGRAYILGTDCCCALDLCGEPGWPHPWE